MAKAKAWFKAHQDQELCLNYLQSEFQVDMAPFHEFEGVITVPTIFTKEGVQNKGLKPWDELLRAAPSLEGKLVVYGHPPVDRPVNPMSDQVIGKTANITAREEDHVLHGDTVIQIEEAPSQFVEELRKGEAREGSVGYWSFSDYTPGVFQNQRYERVERDIVFDHYAVGIPLGACSVSQGCGLGFDEEQQEYLTDEGKKVMGKLASVSSILVGIKDVVMRKFRCEKPDPKNVVDKVKDKGGEKMELNEAEKNIFEARIKELEGSKKTLEDAKTALEAEKAAWETEKSEMAKAKEEVDGKLAKYVEAEEQALADKREAIVKEIVEATEEKPEVYEKWTLEQLEHLKGKVVKEPPKTTDKTALKPGEPAPLEQMYVPGQSMTVGDLVGTKPGEEPKPIE